jgi:hypothetical protein
MITLRQYEHQSGNSSSARSSKERQMTDQRHHTKTIKAASTMFALNQRISRPAMVRGVFWHSASASLTQQYC